MANLYLTHKCRRGCPFCFARKVLKATHDAGEILTPDEIRRFLDHYKKDVDSIGLLGGEPFLYPHLGEIFTMLKERHIHARLFTSATDPLPEALENLDVSDECLHFVVNVGDRKTYNDKQFANLERFFDKFHSVAALSYTIFDLENDNPEFLFDMIDHYQLIRNIRVGIALPIYKGGNSYIAMEDYKKAGEYFCECAERAAKRGIILAMDCGFQACMFDDKQIGRLLKLSSQISFMCGSALDVGPGLKVWNCFPLFQLGCVDALEANSLIELKDKLEKKLLETLPATVGTRPECATCELLHRGRCEGGCKSFNSIE